MSASFAVRTNSIGLGSTSSGILSGGLRIGTIHHVPLAEGLVLKSGFQGPQRRVCGDQEREGLRTCPGCDGLHDSGGCPAGEAM